MCDSVLDLYLSKHDAGVLTPAVVKDNSTIKAIERIFLSQCNVRSANI